jgi:hypothetical protein
MLLKYLEDICPDYDNTKTELNLVYREASRVCQENMPGNFVHLGGDDPLAVLILLWVIRKYSWQLRTLFVCEKLINHPEIQVELKKYANSVQLVDRLLSKEECACNWLGMLALVIIGVPYNPVRLAHTTSLIADQIVTNGSILVRLDCRESEEWQNFIFANEFNMQGQFDRNFLLLRWCRQHEINPELPETLVSEFKQDDPVNAGIATLMSENERFQLYYAVRNLLPTRSCPLRFVEIGSFAGGTFYEISKAIKRSGIPWQGISVEPANVLNFKDVLRCFSDNAVHLEMLSHEATPILERLFDIGNNPVFLLIDGDHRYDSVCRDIYDYYRLLAPGGVIMFHDYLPPCDTKNRTFITSRKGGEGPGIGEACRELLEGQYGLQPLDLPLLYPTDPSQTLASQAIIPGVYSTIRAYRKPVVLKE